MLELLLTSAPFTSVLLHPPPTPKKTTKKLENISQTLLPGKAFHNQQEPQ